MTIAEVNQLPEAEIQRLFELFLQESAAQSVTPSLRSFFVWLEERDT